MATPVVTVASGGIPVVDVSALTPKMGLPVTEVAAGRGLPITVVVGKPGLPIVKVSA